MAYWVANSMAVRASPTAPMRDHRPGDVQSHHGLPETLPFSGQQVFLGNPDILEGHGRRVGGPLSHFVDRFSVADSRESGRDDEADDSLVLLLPVRGGKDQVEVGISPVGNPHLGPVEDIVISLESGRRLHGGRV